METREQLNYILTKWTKVELANKLGVSPITIRNKQLGKTKFWEVEVVLIDHIYTQLKQAEALRKKAEEMEGLI